MDGVPLRSTHAPPSSCEEHACRQSGPERTGTVPENLLGHYSIRACCSAGEEDDGPRYFFAGPDPHGRSADQSSTAQPHGTGLQWPLVKDSEMRIEGLPARRPSLKQPCSCTAVQWPPRRSRSTRSLTPSLTAHEQSR